MKAEFQMLFFYFLFNGACYHQYYFGFLSERSKFSKYFIPMVLIKLTGSFFHFHNTAVKTELFIYCNYRVAIGTC